MGLEGRWNMRSHSLSEVGNEMYFWNNICRTNVLKLGRRMRVLRENL